VNLRARSAGAIACVVAVGAIGVASPRDGERSPAANAAQAADERCPKGARVLPADAVAGAARAALAAAPTTHPAKEQRRVRVTQAALAPSAAARGGAARVRCGRAIQRRTVVVHLDFPAMAPSASLRQGVVLVSRVGTEYEVWATLR